MNLQYISDNRGNTTGIFIPIQDWEALKSKFIGLEEEIYRNQTSEEIVEGLKQAVKEINLVKKGKLEARSAKDLLDEL